MTPWTKRILLLGIFATVIAATIVDKTEGIKLAGIAVGGALALLRGDGEGH